MCFVYEGNYGIGRFAEILSFGASRRNLFHGMARIESTSRFDDGRRGQYLPSCQFVAWVPSALPKSRTRFSAKPSCTGATRIGDQYVVVSSGELWLDLSRGRCSRNQYWRDAALRDLSHENSSDRARSPIPARWLIVWYSSSPTLNSTTNTTPSRTSTTSMRFPIRGTANSK